MARMIESMLFLLLLGLPCFAAEGVTFYKHRNEGGKVTEFVPVDQHLNFQILKNQVSSLTIHNDNPSEYRIVVLLYCRADGNGPGYWFDDDCRSIKDVFDKQDGAFKSARVIRVYPPTKATARPISWGYVRFWEHRNRKGEKDTTNIDEDFHFDDVKEKLSSVEIVCTNPLKKVVCLLSEREDKHGPGYFLDASCDSIKDVFNRHDYRIKSAHAIILDQKKIE